MLRYDTARRYSTDQLGRGEGVYSLALRGSVTADPASPMVVNDRYTKQSADRTHFYTFQSEGQFNCGGRPIRASAIFSASNRPPETVNVCARTAPNDIYIYIDTALNGILNNGGMLKCICDCGLTTGPEFFRRTVDSRALAGNGTREDQFPDYAVVRPATDVEMRTQRD